MALNRVILYGRLTKDPEIRRTTSGISAARFTVACDRQFANKETGKRECDFIEVQAWRNTADFIGRYFSKGDAITVEGSIRNNNYTDNNGVKHYTYVVVADAVGFGGSKNNQNGGDQNVPQFDTVPQYGQPQAAPANIDINDFETVISDGDTPF